MAYPSCGFNCVLNAEVNAWAGCAVASCVCEKATYQDIFYTCIQPCDAADYSAWVSIGIRVCSSYGATFPSSAQSSISTPTSIATGAAIVSTTQAPAVVSVTVTGSVSNLFGLSTTASGGATAVSGATGTSVPVSKSSQSSLSTGATAGIVIGGVALLLIAVLIGVLLWRRPRKQPQDPPPQVPDADTESFSGVVVEGRQHFEKDSKGFQEGPAKEVELAKIVQGEHIASQPVKFARGDFEGRGPLEKPPSPQVAEADSTAMSYNITSISELPDPSRMPELHSTPVLSHSIPSRYSELYTQPSELGSLAPTTAHTARDGTPS